MTHPTVERADDRYEIRVDGEPAGFTYITGRVNRDVVTWPAAGR